MEMKTTVMGYEEICANIKVQNKKFLTQEEVAVLCHLSKKTICKLERSGKLPYAVCLDQLTHPHQIKTEDVNQPYKRRISLP